MLLVEYNVLDKVKVINEGTGSSKRTLLRGKFQKCDEQNNNGRVYPRKVLESQVDAIQDKINERSLVGALDHPANDAIHLSQASHLITKLWVEKDGSVMGECEILSTPNGKIVEALLNDGVKIGISSRGLGSVSESREGKIVNEDFKLITFDLVSDPSTKGAYPELTESIRENSQRAQEIISKHKKQRVLLTMLESKIEESSRIERWAKGGGRDSARQDQWAFDAGMKPGRPKPLKKPKPKPEPKPKEEPSSKPKPALESEQKESPMRAAILKTMEKARKEKGLPYPEKSSYEAAKAMKAKKESIFSKIGKGMVEAFEAKQSKNYVDKERFRNQGMDPNSKPVRKRAIRKLTKLSKDKGWDRRTAGAAADAVGIKTGDPKGGFKKQFNAESTNQIGNSILEGLKKACWKGYEAVGMKTKGGKKVPNCIPKGEK